MKLNRDASEPQDGDSLTIVGFGSTSTLGDLVDDLRDATVPAANQGTCQAAFDVVYAGFDVDVPEESMLCAGGGTADR